MADLPIAVLIDAENIPSRYADDIMRIAKTNGDPIIRRCYGDFTNRNLKGWVDAAPQHSMNLHLTVPVTAQKNVADIALVIDAMDLLYSRQVRGFVLATSDSDFSRLASRLREAGLPVCGIGEAKANAAFRAACGRFVELNNKVPAQPCLITAPVAPPAIAQSKMPKSASSLVDAALKGMKQENNWYSLAELGMKIRRVHPKFKPSTYGKATLSGLLDQMEGYELRTAQNAGALFRPAQHK
ncbi:MAG: NYN domain-containing protein [Rhodobacteraceae bacterium]|nr:NYN domain-containing protein [Paracoccaceae bacterium]